MLRINKPQYSYEQTLDKCIAGITGNTDLQTKLISSKPLLEMAGDEYLNLAEVGDLHTISPINAIINPDPVVINTLKKSELVKIYDTYFVRRGKPAREIYDSLLNAAKDMCPFCGGIGMPRNLDHFLPKAHFPQYSVLPLNLVPSCRDCNMDGKAHLFATCSEDQIIQPYSDDERFFIQQWVFAAYHASTTGEPGEFEYYVLPPENWDEVNKKRVRKHFDDFDLAKRYAINAAARLNTVECQINSLRNIGISNIDIQTCLLQPEIDKALFINHWQVGMYQALSNFIS